jgi:hypothetical protein
MRHYIKTLDKEGHEEIIIIEAASEYAAASQIRAQGYCAFDVTPEPPPPREPVSSRPSEERNPRGHRKGQSQSVRYRPAMCARQALLKDA